MFPIYSITWIHTTYYDTGKRPTNDSASKIQSLLLRISQGPPILTHHCGRGTLSWPVDQWKFFHPWSSLPKPVLLLERFEKVARFARQGQKQCMQGQFVLFFRLYNLQVTCVSLMANNGMRSLCCITNPLRDNIYRNKQEKVEQTKIPTNQTKPRKHPNITEKNQHSRRSRTLLG